MDETHICPDDTSNSHHASEEAKEEEEEDDENEDVSNRRSSAKRRRPKSPSATVKRRRLDLASVWTKLSSHVASLKTSPEVAPWLQILDDLLRQFASSLVEQVHFPSFLRSPPFPLISSCHFYS